MRPRVRPSSSWDKQRAGYLSIIYNRRSAISRRAPFSISTGGNRDWTLSFSLSHSHSRTHTLALDLTRTFTARFRSSAKILTTREEIDIVDSDAIIRFRNKNNRIFPVEGENGQGSDSMVDGGDSAHDRCGRRAACSRQEERPGQSRLSRLFDQVRRVSGE